MLISAHALVGKQDLPIPRELFAWAAAIVLIVSFVALASLWTAPRLAAVREREVCRVPRFLEPLAGALGVLAFAAVVYAGLAGAQNPQTNLAINVVFVVFWVGVPVASVLVGDVFAALNPWRAIGRASGWLVARAGAAAEPFPYPQRLGRWPAAAGLLAFAWVELVYQGRDDPSTVATLALVYAGVNLLGMAAFGERAWSTNADAFGVYFRILSRLAPLQWHDGRLWRRPPVTGVAALAMGPGTLAVILFSIGTTSFDGFTQGGLWADVATGLIGDLRDAGLSGSWPEHLVFSLGLLAVVGMIAGLYQLGVAGARAAAGSSDRAQLARAFGPALVPIAFAYVFAHYFTLLLYQAQALWGQLSDPLGEGSDLFGTAGTTVDYGVLSANAVWYVQVGVLVAGHLAGLLLAHDRALELFGDSRRATRSQYWMLAVMVGFTSLALWLLSAT